MDRTLAADLGRPIRIGTSAEPQRVPDFTPIPVSVPERIPQEVGVR